MASLKVAYLTKELKTAVGHIIITLYRRKKGALPSIVILITANHHGYYNYRPLLTLSQTHSESITRSLLRINRQLTNVPVEQDDDYYKDDHNYTAHTHTS